MNQRKQYPEALHACYVDVMHGKKRILTLGEGIDDVTRFVGLMRKRFVERLCVARVVVVKNNNIDVRINGAQLLELLKAKYPALYPQGREILSLNESYRILCCDLSQARGDAKRI